MWSYYGAKSNVIRLYPPPKYGKIIEPFAGTARYSCLYWDREITLIDKYSVITDIWKWLQKCSVSDIRKLPCSFKQGQNIKANWMDFMPMGKHKGTHGAQSEVIWTNLKTSFSTTQPKML